MKTIVRLVAAIAVVLFVSSTDATAKARNEKTLEDGARAVIAEYTAKYEPLDLKLRKFWYKYNTTGDKKASDTQAKTEFEIRTLNSDPNRFAKLKELFADRENISDPIVRRQIEFMYLAHLPNQASKENLKKLTELAQKIEQTYNDYRPVVDGKTLSPADVAHALSDSTDNTRLEKVWKEQQLLGAKVEGYYKELVRTRNEIARGLGYRDAVALAAETMELPLPMLDKFYNDLHDITEKPFRKLKEKFLDTRLAKRYGIKVSELGPWHYQNQFFQEAPTAVFGKVDLDALYKNMDSNFAVGLARDFYSSMGIDVSGILKNSSLFPKPGKNPHAFAEMLNPNIPGTSVLLMNLPMPPEPPKSSDVSTLVHELSHDINYEATAKNPALPYLLKNPTMLTEGIAMLFEQQTQTSNWFARIGITPEKAKETVESVGMIDYVDQLIFLRWASTIYCFEKQYYADPNQDIGDLWWGCREKHQLLKRPPNWRNPDALAKYHIPNVELLYYSNYAIGRVANVQFADLLAKKIGSDVQSASYFGKKELGDWLMTDFLAQGERYRWDDFIKTTTGEPLSLKPWKKFYLDSGLEKRLFEN